MKHIELKNGLKDGLPICLGYLAVSFSFGMVAVGGGLPVWAAAGLSMTNLTSAGQFAALNLMLANAPLVEIGLATLIINIRYLLMSLVLSQKLEKMPLAKRLLLAFGITDEIFTVASTRYQRVGFWYMLGLIVTPYIGWSAGTVLGACINGLLPAAVSNALGISLYAMFIAIVIPAARQDRAVGVTLLLAVAISCGLYYIPGLSALSAGWAVILTTVAASALAATFLPREEGEGL